MEQKANSGKGNKGTRIVRDIADSLGKLPPQAVDVEEAILGALMLQREALEVLPMLSSNHFYSEQHKVIYSAITNLAAAKNPVDMRTVVMELRRTGHLEIIGGSHYIAELTSKVSSSANIKYHATIVKEMSLKREMILLASRIHQAAYEDTTDGPELLEQIVKKFTVLQNTELAMPLQEQIKQTWIDIQVTDEPAWVEPYIRVQQTPVATAGEMSLIVGKKKSRKSLFTVWELSEFLKNHSEACVFDTEQGKRHIWKARDRVFRLTGKHIPYFSMRDRSPKERIEIITQTLAHWPFKFKLVVIDGIRDLMTDINSPEESTEVMTWLQKMTSVHNIHIINILHLNKTDKNPRGHIGTELMNKAEVTIELELDEETQVTMVKCESSRERGFEAFAFTHSSDDLPMMTDMPMGDRKIPIAEQQSRLKSFMGDQILKYKELVEEIKINFECSDRKAKTKVAEFKRAGWLLAIGEKGAKDMQYKLNLNGLNTITPEMKPLHEVQERKKQEEKEPPMDLFHQPVDEPVKPKPKPKKPEPVIEKEPESPVKYDLDDLPF